MYTTLAGYKRYLHAIFKEEEGCVCGECSGGGVESVQGKVVYVGSEGVQCI